MTEDDISDTLEAHLVAGVGLPPIVWPNKAAEHEAPYLIYEQVPTSTIDPTLTGFRARYRGYLMISVLSDRDAFRTPGLSIAQAVKARFPYASRLPAGDGHVVIVQVPEILQGYRDGDLWRTPVRVNYEAV